MLQCQPPQQPVRQGRRRGSGPRRAGLGLILLLGMGAVGEARGGEPIDLSAAEASFDLTSSLEVLEDPSGKLSIEEVSAAPFEGRFRRRGGSVLDLGDSSTWWLRFSYVEPSSSRNWHLSIARLFLSSVHFYLPAPDGGWALRKKQVMESDTLGYGLLNELTSAGPVPRTFYIRLGPGWRHLVTAKLCVAEACQRAEGKRILAYGVSYGVLLVMALVSLVLAAAFRDRAYLYHFIFVVFLSGYFLIDNGIALGPLRGLQPAGLFKIFGFFASMMVVWSGIFSRAFLETRRIAPGADKLILAYTGLAAALWPLMMFGQLQLLHGYMTMMGLLAPVVIVVPGVICWWRGFRPARGYLLAWSLFALGGAVVAIPQTHPWGSTVFQTSATLGVLLLNLALLQKMRGLREEKQELELARRQAVEAMRESERRFRGVFEQTFQFMGLCRPDGTVLEVNRSALEFVGASAADVVGRPLWETPWWTSLADGERRLHEACDRAAAGEHVRFDALNPGSDGREGHVDFSLKPMRDESGQVALLIAEGHDITDRVRSEAALRESEAKHRAIFENAQVALFRIRVSDGQMLEANAVMARIYGYSSREEFVRSFSMTRNWVDPEDRHRLFRDFETGRGVVNNFEARFYRQDGSNFWARFSARHFPEQGYMEGVGQDITEEKTHQEELRASEARYRAIFDTAASAMIIYDESGRILLANEQFRKLTAYSQQDIEAGMSWTRLFSGQTLERMQSYHQIRGVDPSGAPRSYEATLVDRRGQQHHGLVMVDLIPGTAQRVAAFLDLTERKQAEQQMLRADKMAALGQIIAGVAHEINNPNNFIYFNMPILRRYLEALRPLLDHHLEADPELKILNLPYADFIADMMKLLDNMQHGSERITGIVSELKSYIRGPEVEERHPTSIEKVTDRVMTLMGKQVQKMVKRFEVSVEPDLPPVLINAGKIEQVLINLILNAAQAADKEDSTVSVQVRRATQPGWLAILVEDNGSGIPEEHLARIFDPFFTTKSRESGTGLGLAISQRIVEEHGGRLSVESAAGQGSCFTLLLPLAAPAENGPAARSQLTP